MRQDKPFKTNDMKYSAALTRDLFTVEDGRNLFYGGSQNMYATPKERSNGCGIAGAADIIMYFDAVSSTGKTFTKDEFLSLSNALRKHIPIIPGRGVNAFLLARGLNKYFKKNGLHYRSRWKWTWIKKWETVERMLNDDIPVILAIGNNFPWVWGKKQLNLYSKDEKETDPVTGEPVYKKAFEVCGHFVVITAIEGNCLSVSSWGKKYYINIDEYNRYVRKHSIHLYCNILEIKKCRHAE